MIKTYYYNIITGQWVSLVWLWGVGWGDIFDFFAISVPKAPGVPGTPGPRPLGPLGPICNSFVQPV